MQKTVKEIIDMINAGTLNYNQSTQRKFVYADMDAQLDGYNGKVTKAGSLIHSILEEDIQLPAVYFWHNTETKSLNIHDGKQRLLSIYYFINPTPQFTINTVRNGKGTNFAALSQADKDKLLNYTFDIVERSGTSAEEERSFYLINTNSVNLTAYECVSGMLHGNYLTGFENYIDRLAVTKTVIKPIHRGEQAYRFLLTMFDIADSKKTLGADPAIINLCDAIRDLRNNTFDPKRQRFNEILELFADLATVTKNSKIKEERLLAVAAYVIRKNYLALDIKQLYERSVAQRNDIASWDLATHKTFIDYFVENNYAASLDPQRNFTKDIKDQLYAQSGRCANVDTSGNLCTETNYSKLEVDHITPWSKGGRTILGNAQLLCKHHNTSKGNRP